MSILRRQPFTDLMTLRDAVDRLFEENLVPPVRLPCVAPMQVPIDLYQQQSNLIVKASLPGARPEDIAITVTSDAVTIKGEVKKEAEIREENAIRRERCYGAFARTVPLPQKVDTQGASATFENGVLTLTLPASEESRAREVRIQTTQG